MTVDDLTGMVFRDGARCHRSAGRAVCLAFELLDCHGFAPRLDVRVWLAERERVALKPVTLFADGGRVGDELAVAVDDVLARGGRSRLTLHWDADEDSWALTD